MYARVVVNQASNKTDRLYDYKIPEDVGAGVGSRVIVPFGRGNNNMEAYVMYLSETSDVRTVKEIIKAVGGRVFDEKMRDLIFIMKQKYLCRYIDLIRAVIPAGIEIKPEKWVIYDGADNEEYGKFKPLSENESKIVRYIADNGGGIRYSALMDGLGENFKSAADRMIREGIIKTEYRDTSRISESTVKVASIVDTEDAERMLESLKRAPVQAKMAEILLSAGKISISDLQRFSGGSHSAVKALEKKGIIEISEMQVFRNPMKAERRKEMIPEMTDSQKRAVDTITQNRGMGKPYLLHGVTGSGKTEVYMRITDSVIRSGKTAVILVPEISLTPQTVSRFYSRFGGRIAVLHSRLSMGERYDEWQRIQSGEADIVIGARSAVFAPLDNIGVIIMDEEHEQSYKSDMTPRYHARDIVEFRARQYSSMVIYASATPCIESYYKAETGEYIYVPIDERINGREMPSVDVIDMRCELADGNRSVISRHLRAEIEKNLERREQTILFLNRRGFSTFVLCRNCGYEVKCPNCSISLTYHKYDDSLRCHYCGFVRPNYTVCPECGSRYIRYFGGGTQKVEEEVHELF
ncbi:MAG: primosomal protein N', partial [Oscillospiraceae bacterium]|nr:primosomal protein N' [Oscillospiraceae bacterium]